MFKRAEFEITYKCNLNCLYCYRGFLTRKELDTQSCLDIIHQIKRIGIKEIHLTGGEPLLREDIYSLLTCCSNLGFKTVLETNGTLIDSNSAYKIKKSGVSRVKISLDGPKELHDYLRGNNSFSAVIKGIKYLIDHGQYTEIQLTLSKLNSNNISEVLSLCNELCINSFRVRLLLPGGKGLKCKNLLLTPEEVAKVYKELEISKKKYPFYIHNELLKEESIERDMMTSFSIDPAGYVRPYVFSNTKLNKFLDIQSYEDLESMIKSKLPTIREDCKVIEDYISIIRSGLD